MRSKDSIMIFITRGHSDVEVADQHISVTDFVRRIAKDVGRKDPRLKIDEVISVGSAIGKAHRPVPRVNMTSYWY